MSHSVNKLQSYDEIFSTYFLQEYFIPVNAIELFIKDLINIKNLYHINIINPTLRFCPAQKNSLLAYAKQDCFACVLYWKVTPSLSIENNNEIWTQKLIDAALTYNGTYYLPYQPWATQNQFERAYPNTRNFLKLKKIFDSLNKWQNALYTQYIKHLE